ncbi:hypothetical protein HMPREF9371_0756 [Neisseria shayeganii 871]|uniref:Uncharacterized protein n=1 Tax=Neisseria shayeganii 871 TaxID=1032488 RepID=G4CGL7_9NEIS|nr:hypothetical protein HMPREF9371_0756 [Neisseria shayeganii 871]
MAGKRLLPAVQQPHALIVFNLQISHAAGQVNRQRIAVSAPIQDFGFRIALPGGQLRGNQAAADLGQQGLPAAAVGLYLQHIVSSAMHKIVRGVERHVCSLGIQRRRHSFAAGTADMLVRAESATAKR